MCAYLADSLASCHVSHTECVVGGDGVECGGEEGPLEVEDGSLGNAGEQTVVCVGWICAPEG